MKNVHKPIIGITIGDPAGIGPEIILKALKEKKIYEACRPFVIGCTAALERASGLLIDQELQFNSITAVSAAKFVYGTIDVYETVTMILHDLSGEKNRLWQDG